MPVTYKNLFTQVSNLIDGRIKYNTNTAYGSQDSHVNVAPFALSSTAGDVSLNTLVQAIVSIMQETVPRRILSGLDVEATSPISSSVIIRAGKGTSGGQIYELEEDTTVDISLTTGKSVYFINLYPNRIVIEASQEELTIAKIIVPNPGVTEFIQDTQDSSWNAYIQSFKEYKLYGMNDRFEEDTIDLFRDNIGEILADNIIGNIRLNENLKITNTAGTLELDSEQILLKDFDGNILTKLNHKGTYFYDADGHEIAKFSVDGARVGNIVVTTNSIECGDFVAGTGVGFGKGFQIKDTGDAEFNNVIIRGKMSATVFEKDTVSSVGGSLLVSDSDVLALDMTALDSETLTISGDTTLSVGDILRIKNGIDDEWFVVTDASSAPTYVVTRDSAGVYGADSNPTWTAGAAVINYGASDEGLIYMTASEDNGPYMEVLGTGSTPWIAPTRTMRMGNLNGFLDYATDAYGVAIGEDNSYLKYDPINGLRIKGNVTITGGSTTVHTYYQPGEPGSSGDPTIPINGDYWVDTDNGNSLYVYNSGIWEAVNSGFSTSGITFFKQTGTASGETPPTSLAIGDMWLDTHTNRLYRAESVGANTISSGEWVETLEDLGATPDIDAGLYLSSDYFGYYNGTKWTAYFDNSGHVEIQDIKLQDPNCCCCYSFLYSGALKFHDELGDVPYVKRICSGVANSGDTICLLGWKTAPNIQIGVIHCIVILPLNQRKTNNGLFILTMYVVILTLRQIMGIVLMYIQN